MPRKRPSRLRPVNTVYIKRFARPFRRCSVVPGLSRSAQVAIARLERDRLWPGAITVALRFWAAFVRGPYHRLYDPHYPGCGFWECRTLPRESRAVLETVCHVLPQRDARILRRRLAALDDEPPKDTAVSDLGSAADMVPARSALSPARVLPW